MRAKTTNSDVEALEGEIVARLDSLPIQNAENLRRLRRELSQQLKQKPADLVTQLALKLVGRSQFQFRFMTYELLVNHQPALQSVDEKMLTALGKGLDSWMAVDMFGCYVAGPVWRERQVGDKLIESWTQSQDRWWRRAALVSTVPLNIKSRGGAGDSQRTIKICERLIADRDEMVVKAMSWALRELAKRQPAVVEDFIKQHDRELAPRVKREVGNKLRTGVKNPKP